MCNPYPISHHILTTFGIEVDRIIAQWGVELVNKGTLGGHYKVPSTQNKAFKLLSEGWSTNQQLLWAMHGVVHVFGI